MITTFHLIGIFVWLELSLTYLILKRLRDYGYSEWYNAEFFPWIKFLIKKTSLGVGIILGIFINTLVFWTYLIIFNIEFCHGAAFGMLILVVVNNIKVLSIPPKKWDKKPLGEINTRIQHR